jgi:hypothetical protein
MNSPLKFRQQIEFQDSGRMRLLVDNLSLTVDTAARGRAISTGKARWFDKAKVDDHATTTARRMGNKLFTPKSVLKSTGKLRPDNDLRKGGGGQATDSVAALIRLLL